MKRLTCLDFAIKPIVVGISLLGMSSMVAGNTDATNQKTQQQTFSPLIEEMVINPGRETYRAPLSFDRNIGSSDWLADILKPQLQTDQHSVQVPFRPENTKQEQLDS